MLDTRAAAAAAGRAAAPDNRHAACGCTRLRARAVPVLGGRTPLQAYTQLLGSFRDAFAPLLGSLVSDAEVGLGPGGNLCYPSTPRDARWNFPGIGEFQVRKLADGRCAVGVHAT